MRLLAATLLLSCAPAFAITGNDLLKMLEDKRTAGQLGSLGYVRGFLDGSGVARFAASQEGNELGAKQFCPPDGVSADQALDVVRAYLSANPALRHHDGGALAGIAMADAWPCKGR